MPELPEVETVREGLARHLLGHTFREVQVLDERSLRRHPRGRKDFVDRLQGRTVRDVVRRGKYLWILLSAADSAEILPESLVVHLGMSGQALITAPEASPHRHLRVRALMVPPGQDKEPLELRFVDQRIFGGMFLDRTVLTRDAVGQLVPAGSRSLLGRPEIPSAVAHIARDPLDPFFDTDGFRRRVRGSAVGIKRLLLDQSTVSGIGNIYADEALWRARLHYARPSSSLSAAQTRGLLEACTAVMAEALTAGGTSFDALYVNVNGESGYFERGLNAYGRAEKPCPRCAAVGRTGRIVREPFMNRSSYRCTFCQRRPSAR